MQVCEGCLKSFSENSFRTLKRATRNAGKVYKCSLCEGERELSGINKRTEKVRASVDRLRVASIRKEWKHRRAGEMRARERV